ncbi:ATP-binding protein [Flammeovirgaceae bacterium SG7u.111]|nr:ATP-binding protein [Flammeovirgaceae bacterium SG7u.132]WPO38363.1 ATP-binding protein [Flammeovirgaceae bacterium SG7u.111]
MEENSKAFMDNIAKVMEDLAVHRELQKPSIQAISHLANSLSADTVQLFSLQKETIELLANGKQFLSSDSISLLLKNEAELVEKDFFWLEDVNEENKRKVAKGTQALFIPFSIQNRKYLASYISAKNTLFFQAPYLPLLLAATKQVVQKHGKAAQQAEASSAADQVNTLILDAAGEGIFQLDKQGKVIYMNKPAKKMLRFSSREKLSTEVSIQDILEERLSSKKNHPIDLTLENGEKNEVEYEVFRRQDSTTFPVEYISTGIKDKNGKVIGAVVTAKDISEKLKAKEGERKLLKHIRVRMKELDCLYKISRLTVDISQEEDFVLQQVALLIPSAWDDDRQSHVRILFKGKAFESEGFSETIWKTEKPVLAGKKRIGALEVYHSDAPDMLVEESFYLKENNMLETMSSQIGNFHIRKTAETELKESNRKFTTLIQNLPGVVFRSNDSWKLEFISEGCHQISGVAPKDFLKKKNSVRWSSLILPEDRKGVTKKIKSALELGTSYQVDYRITTLYGEQKWIWEQGIGIYDDLKLKAVEGFLFDITNNKKAEEELIASYKERQALITNQKTVLEATVAERTKELEKLLEETQKQSSQLQEKESILNTQNKDLQETLLKLKSAQSKLIHSEKMASLGQLTAGIAHEINNPVNFISSSIEGLRDVMGDLLEILNKYEGVNKENLEEKITEIEELKHVLGYDELLEGIDLLTNNIHTGVERTAEIVNELKAFSRVDQAEVKTVDLHKSIESTLVMLRSQYKDIIQVNKQFGELPQVECFPGKLNQVFMNLILNAIHAIQAKEKNYTGKKPLPIEKEKGDIFPESGSILIQTKLLSKGDVQLLKLSNSSDWVEINIADSGIGIPIEIRDKVFEPFFTTKDVGEGTGLGLSVSLGIIQQHNGVFELESEENRGTNFKIFLPVTASY